ncbi:MAG TPA: hypothetical protein VFG18_07970 [Xanthomonadaceae bacterium]|nr:hypothetical protein [Xanthomonadaceae bacterium]
MTKIVRSPRAPSFSLEESVKNALAIYDGNGKHSIPTEVAAKALGYSGANNGSAARALASMKSFGLLEANNKGDVSVSADVEGYQYAPDDQHRQDLLIRWLLNPKVYSELLNEYQDRLPSDQAIRYKLIKMGFLPAAAEECLKNFRASVDFARYYERREEADRSEAGEWLGGTSTPEGRPVPPTPPAPAPASSGWQSTPAPTPPSPTPQIPPAPAPGFDRIPVRLSKGRRAWIEVPTPLFDADKAILKAQIDLILTDEEDVDPFA